MSIDSNEDATAWSPSAARKSLGPAFAPPPKMPSGSTPAEVVELSSVQSSESSSGAAESKHDDTIVPSTVHLAVDIAEGLARESKRTGRTHGEVVITAIEDVHADLEKLLFPGGKIGGGLFRARGVGSKPLERKAEKKGVTVGLYSDDWVIIDQLKDEFKARSRSHLIGTALKAHLGTEDTTRTESD
ncbi:hypothetical protein [Rhodococcus sp. EPR-157]|uniref:hypothetical protein n=1 Tax=Rhodococcus sp. EPR-157 TaxID=1813677 RepID=UPI000AE8177F|nr:hypothetical protein [Rhodococcus sp. EPR-157]